jgi:hypothetical protein
LIAPENEAGALGTRKEEIARRGAERAEKKGRQAGGVRERCVSLSECGDSSPLFFLPFWFPHWIFFASLRLGVRRGRVRRSAANAKKGGVVPPQSKG